MNEYATIQNEEAHRDVDAMLGDFFQAEIPHPWPTLKTPVVYPVRPVGSFWSRASGRLALAACIAALVAGYVALSGSTPRRADPHMQHLHNIGQGHKKGPVIPSDDRPMPMN